jgi:hypothetical protein
VQVIDAPFIPEDRIPFNRANVAAVQVGGRWKVAEGNHWMLDTGSSQAEAERAVEIINHYKLASMCFVGRPRCGDVRPMMYWLTDAGRAPSGQLAGEDCIAFDRSNLAVVEIGGRWKVVEGTHWLLDFGSGQGNAIAALHFIRKHRFDEICFVGRPDPSMTYFKTRGRRRIHIELIDPRRIEAAIDEPRWWAELAKAADALAPAVDFSTEPVGVGPNPRDVGAVTAHAHAAEETEVVQKFGLAGLATGRELELRLRAEAEVVDVGLVHFGEAPTIAAHAGEKQAARVTADERARQIENLRLIAAGIDRLVITSPDGNAIVSYIRLQPRQARRATRRKKTS